MCRKEDLGAGSPWEQQYGAEERLSGDQRQGRATRPTVPALGMALGPGPGPLGPQVGQWLNGLPPLEEVKTSEGPASVAQWTEHCPVDREVPVRFWVRAHARVAGSIPSRGRAGGGQLMFLSHVDVAISLSKKKNQ
uniref:Uncharacterized protein n=1 Tax=Molossus molossus TaxID=27622 RepID=A0A7J8JXD1_MOLMO|nr:hypothetical protein HJG59_008127 [Molossus molossus]